MTAATDFTTPDAAAARTARRERWHTRINRAAGTLDLLGFGWLVALLRMAAGDNVRQQGKEQVKGLKVVSN